MPYLVRHAHAGDKQIWRGPDTLRHEFGVDADPAGLVELLMDRRPVRPCCVAMGN